MSGNSVREEKKTRVLGLENTHVAREGWKRNAKKKPVNLKIVK